MRPRETRNFYNLLGVSVTATTKDISDAYHKKTKEYHPDKFVNSDAEGKKKASEYFADINAAYEILSDPVERAKYNIEYVVNSLGDNYQNLKGVFTTEQLLEALHLGHTSMEDVKNYWYKIKENTIIGAQLVGVVGKKVFTKADEYLMKAMRKIRGK